jgi:replicative DNA helicase
MDIEWAILSKVIEVGGLDALVEARVGASFFMDTDNAEVFRWMLHHWTEYGVTPGTDAFRHEFPAYALIATPEPLEYYLGELRSQRQFAMVNEMLDTIKDPLRRGDADIAIKILNSSLEGLHTEIADLRDEDLTQTTEERLAYYDRLARSPGILGLPTGFPTMDLATGGLQREQLITLVGFQKRFKSMLLMCMNIAVNAAGHSTLFASFEMSTQEQSTRHDALRAGISLTRLQNGKIRPDEKTNLNRMMHGLEDYPPMTFVHDPSSTTTVSGLAAKIAQYRPDVVFVDGTYLMDCEIPRVEPHSPQALTSITRSLKRLAQRSDIPIVQTTQALESKARSGRLTLNSIGYSSSFAQDSDVIFGVEEIKEHGEISDKEIMLRIVAARNCPRRDVRLALDLERGSITETEVDFDSDDMDDTDDA